MNLIEERLTNFRSHADTVFRFEPLLMIGGTNGAGKSTLLRAVSFALFGEAAGDLDAFVADGQQWCQVELTFEIAQTRYRVLRARSLKSRGSSRLELQIQNPLFDGADGVEMVWQPLTGGSIQETQRKLEEVLRLDAETWAASAMMAQGEAGFSARKPTERKAILSSILQLDAIYPPLKDEALQAQRGWDAAIISLNRRLDECRTAAELVELKTPDLQAASDALAVETRTVKALEAQLAELQERIAHLSAQGARAKELTARRTAVQRELAVSKGELAKAAVRRQELETALSRRDQVVKDLANLAAARERSAAFSSSRRAHDEWTADERLLTERVHEALRAHERFTLESGGLIQKAETAVARLEKSDCPIIDRKPQCVFLKDAFQQAEALPELMRQREETGNELGRRVLSARNDHAACKRQIEKLGYQATAHHKVDAEVARLASAERAMAMIEAAGTQLQELAQRDQQLASSIEAKEAEDLSLLGQIVRLDEAAEELTQLGQSRSGTAAALEHARAVERTSLSEVAKLQALIEQLHTTAGQLDQAIADLDRAQSEAYIYKELATAFGPNGIPALVIDNVVPWLAEMTNRWLGRMTASGEVLRVELVTKRANKTVAGEKETLDVIVHVGDHVRAFESLSGGEQVRVEFCQHLALGELAARRAGARVESLLIDEGGFGQLDASGIQAFIEAVREIQKDFKKVVVISHSPAVQDAGWPAVVTVRKEAGVSRIEVA